jgi:hypothetical protein
MHGGVRSLQVTVACYSCSGHTSTPFFGGPTPYEPYRLASCTQADFRRCWLQQIRVLLVREREKVGSATAQGDWPRRAWRANALGEVAAGAV